ncbi:MAG: TonB family protein [Oleiphilaceae bacterium]
MENTDKFILRFYLALFSSIISHSIILIALFAFFPNFELEKKTIPFQLMSSDRYGQNSNSATLSKSENTLAAQEFLRTLNESTFDQLIREKNRKTSKNRDTPSPFKQHLPSDSPFINKPIFLEKSNASNAFQGLQDIFSKQDSKQTKTENKQKISTQALEELSQYEIQLLQKLAEDELYDEFHPVMSKNKQTNINYVISLNLFANGAIKSATIRQSSNIPEIDQLAIKAAYLASPFPKPPKEDINNNFKYDIPIIYQKKVNE